jgi:hypothetical protein
MRKRCNGERGVGGQRTEVCKHKARGVFNLLGGLKHLHDSFDPLHTEATLWITDVQLREGALGTSDNWRMGADDALDPAVYRTLI